MNKINKIFVTGTDTEVGKTFVSVLLLKIFNQMGMSTVGLKPVASGCEYVDGQLRNDDALQLQRAASVPLDYATVNPLAFEPPIAPHIAAQQQGLRLSVGDIITQLSEPLKLGSDMTIIEGAGGWLVPLNESETYADVVIRLDIPVVLTVGIKLGCINHTLLTVRAIKASGVRLLGWFANCLVPTTKVQEENIQTLKNALEIPCLGVLPYIADRSE